MNMSSGICVAGSILFSFLFVGEARSQEILYQPAPDSPIGERNADAPKGTGQYDFLIGDWDVDVSLFRPEQEPFVYKAKWHNHWIADGYVVMQEWRGPYATGIELRSYDPASDQWQGRNIYYPSPGTWYSNIGEMKDKQMTVTTVRTDAEGLETISREIYWDITDKSFRIRTERSIDGGATWQRGKYELIAHRIGEEAN
jgi:hypothetical protein